MPRWIRIMHEEKSRFGWLDGDTIQLCHGDMFGIAEVTGESVPLAAATILPPVEPRKVPDIVKFEAVQQIPFPLDEVDEVFRTVAAGEALKVMVEIGQGGVAKP